MKNAPATAEERGVIKYTTKGGEELTLSSQIIRDYLVCGNRELVTEQELMFFKGICKARGLNPFLKDVYLVKYSSEPAAIITSIDYFRARARAQKDCHGWKCGVIVIDKDGKLKDTAGLVLDGETLVGGFFEATPAGWEEPRRLEVNLRGYIKKTNAGKITKFWQPDNQPTMIAKVAESQGLRSLWPNEFQSIYEQSEILAPDDDDIVTSPRASQAQTERPKTFADCVPKGTNMNDLNQFLQISADQFGRTVEEQKTVAINNPGFWQGLESFGATVDAPIEAGTVSPLVNDKTPEDDKEPEPNEPATEKAQDAQKANGTYIPGCPTMKSEGQRHIKYCRTVCKEQCQAYLDAKKQLKSGIPGGKSNGGA